LPADHPVSPTRAVAVDPVLVEEHPSLVDRELWKGAQARAIEEHGLFTWLDELLAAIGGAKVVTGPDGEPTIDDTEPPGGVHADQLEAFVLGKLRPRWRPGRSGTRSSRPGSNGTRFSKRSTRNRLTRTR
jgi:hypothetical protein